MFYIFFIDIGLISIYCKIRNKQLITDQGTRPADTTRCTEPLKYVPLHLRIKILKKKNSLWWAQKNVRHR